MYDRHNLFFCAISRALSISSCSSNQNRKKKESQETIIIIDYFRRNILLLMVQWHVLYGKCDQSNIWDVACKNVLYFSFVQKRYTNLGTKKRNENILRSKDDNIFSRGMFTFTFTLISFRFCFRKHIYKRKLFISLLHQKNHFFKKKNIQRYCTRSLSEIMIMFNLTFIHELVLWLNPFFPDSQIVLNEYTIK